ncbi:MAG: 2-phospho-L-lactate transferase [Anaerolineae bacterium]|nr:2-phospho-L-lactate transferase [Anaerolineae bacterium]
MAINVVALAGGVGGAKLALGLMHALGPDAGRLTVIVNVGDDFEHYGFYVCTDLDTVMYTLAGIADPLKGWGLPDDTGHTLDMLRQYGETIWFYLGDRDLATHILRTMRHRAGARLTDITADLCGRLGIKSRVLPVTDARVSTLVDTVEMGTLGFQEYFVRERWAPTVTRLRYKGAESARLTPEVEAALDRADLIVFCPSNPVLSIDPVLAVGDMRARLAASRARRAAVSPIVQGMALKGPAAKLMAEMGIEVTPVGVAAHYDGLLDGFVLDVQDAAHAPRIRELGLDPLVTDTVMKTDEDKRRLAEEILMWSDGKNKDL